MRAFQCFNLFFKCICILIAFAMAGFWIRKFLKNEDVTLIQYETLSDSDSTHLPAMSICLVNPFFIGNESFENTTDAKYNAVLKYLQGKGEFNEDFRDVFYGIETFNILDYLNSTMVFHFLKNEQHNETTKIYSNLSNCPFLTFENTFNGFSSGQFVKCFEMRIEKKYSSYVRHVIFGFKKSFKEIVRRTSMIIVGFNYPGQLLLNFNFDQYLWKDENDTTTMTGFKMDAIEIIQRRKKENGRCLVDSINYDNLRIREAIEKAGCKALYHKLEDDLPICDGFEELATFDLTNLLREKFIPPCDEISPVPFKLQRTGPIDFSLGLYSLNVGYPGKIKLITQQKAIDIHALIGNIGGYIGLFLGNSKF